jgi:hypothetical protein
MTLVVVHPPCAEIDIVKEASFYCAKDTCYFVPQEMGLLKWAKSTYQFEKERNEWIRKYENVLNGLKYWRNKALEL